MFKTKEGRDKLVLAWPVCKTSDKSTLVYYITLK